MAKIILEFDSVEESQDARVALDAMRWKMAVWDLDQKLRQIVKYGTSILNEGIEAGDVERETADKIRGEIRSILDSSGLNLLD